MINFLINNNESSPSILEYYTNELINSQSIDYATIYLALKKLKSSISQTKLLNYQTSINNNVEFGSFKKTCEKYRASCLSKANSQTGNVALFFKIQANFAEVPVARANYFLNKIHNLSNDASL